jgi:YfiR/HmsC-like
MSATFAPLRRRGARMSVVVAIFAVVWNGSVAAQSVSGSALKAAFLYNFAKFADWPADILAPGQRLSLCVLGDNAVADALEQTIKAHSTESHELTVQMVGADWPIRSCHLLYVGGLDVKGAMQLIDALKGAPIFTVSDCDRFAELGGVAQLILEKDRMRFAINVAAAQRARLQLSSKLLSLAKIVKDERYVQP